MISIACNKCRTGISVTMCDCKFGSVTKPAFFSKTGENDD